MAERRTPKARKPVEMLTQDGAARKYAPAAQYEAMLRKADEVGCRDRGSAFDQRGGARVLIACGLDLGPHVIDYSEGSSFVDHACLFCANAPSKGLKNARIAGPNEEVWETRCGDASCRFNKVTSGHNPKGNQSPRQRGDEKAQGIA